MPKSKEPQPTNGLPTIEELKVYLGIDGSQLDSLLADFLNTAREMVETVLRYSLDELNLYPSLVKNAIKYVVAKLYVERENADIKEMQDMVARILQPLRRQVF